MIRIFDNGNGRHTYYPARRTISYVDSVIFVIENEKPFNPRTELMVDMERYDGHPLSASACGAA